MSRPTAGAGSAATSRKHTDAPTKNDESARPGVLPRPGGDSGGATGRCGRSRQAHPELRSERARRRRADAQPGGLRPWRPGVAPASVA